VDGKMIKTEEFINNLFKANVKDKRLRKAKVKDLLYKMRNKYGDLSKVDMGKLEV
jgi:hypothetical protein